MRRTIVVGALCATMLVVGPPSSAGHRVGHGRPTAAARVAFGEGFPALTDSEWGFPLGGFGGVRPGAPATHVPVILVHGNNVDAADWYPVVDVLHANGYTDQEIWALSYNGRGCNNGTALFTPNPRAAGEHGSCSSVVTGNDVNVPDLIAFIAAVRDYTGSSRFSIVAHSLGVTLARKAVAAAGLTGDLVGFVGIAGANHGTDFCPPGSEGVVMSCDEIAFGTRWLADLNGGDETPGPAAYMTVYDGSGVGDPAFLTPVYAQSPRLEGALNCGYPGFYHNDLRVDPRIAAQYVSFLLDAERGAAPASCPVPPPPLPY